jgi:hypothetical protein
MARFSLDNVEDLAGVNPIDVVRSILAESGGLARFMEVHYLAGEPELFEIMRMVAALKPTERTALAEFLKRAVANDIQAEKTSARLLELVRDHIVGN